MSNHEQNEDVVLLSTSQKEKSLIRDLIRSIDSSGNYWYHKEDKCMYFILDTILYGYTIINHKKVFNEALYVFWQDDADFSLKKQKKGGVVLNKRKTNNFVCLNFDDLVLLYTKINAESNLTDNDFE